MALGLSLLQVVAFFINGSLQTRVEVFVSQRAPSRIVSIDVLQSEHAPHRRGARTFLYRHDAARVQRSETLAGARQPHPGRATSDSRAARWRLFRAVELLPSLHHRFLSALSAARAREQQKVQIEDR